MFKYYHLHQWRHVKPQGAVKHGFVSNIAGGCSSYDVIALSPDLTWPFFLPKVAQGLPHKVPQNAAAHTFTMIYWLEDICDADLLLPASCLDSVSHVSYART